MMPTTREQCLEEVYYVAELVCLNCSRECGEIELQRPDQPVMHVRCGFCGGMPMARELTRRMRWVYDLTKLQAMLL